MGIVLNITIALVGGMFAAELAGYFLHMLLHSNKIKFLSSSHMIHHMKIYGPKSKLLTKKFNEAVTNRFSLFGIGLEWWIPVASYAIGLMVIGVVLKINLIYIGIFMAAGLFWGFGMFNYMHDAMHIKNFWMERTWLKNWFLRARRLHFLHHTELSDDGRMNINYGICFFFFDRIFFTFLKQGKAFNNKGMVAAEKRYDYL